MKTNILITGVLGYIGTALCELYKNSQNYKVIGIDNNFVHSTIKWLIDNNIYFYQKDLFSIRDLIERADIIFHLASVTDAVPKTKEESNKEIDDLIYKTGVLGTREIIKYARKDAKIILTSTQVLFEGLKEETLDINENFEPCPILMYAKSKRQNEIDLYDSNHIFNIVRLASVYGYNERSMRYKIVANFFAKMAALDQKIKVFGDGMNYKPLIGIKDVVRCLKFLAESNYNKEIYHLVNENYRVNEIAQICQKYNTNLIIENTLDKIPNLGYTLSNKKILNTGFEFKQNLDEEIGKMIKIWSNKILI